jgi:acyl carrier protein
MTSRRHEIEEQLRRFLIDELIEDFYGQPYDGEDPLADGVVDSLGIEQLIEHLNATFGVALGEDDIVVENFESLPALAALVESKCQVEL